MNNKDLAKTIIEKVGGLDNIISCTHCVTRLRFALRDSSKALTEEIKALDGVMGVAEGNGQYQVIIGTNVNDVFNEVEKLLPASNDANEKGGEERTKLAAFLEGLSSLFAPAIMALTAGGLIKAIEALLVALKVISNSGQTYLLLSYLADAPFYFLPFLLAYGTARRFKGDIGMALMLAGFLLYPSISGLFTNADGAAVAVKFFGFLPVTKMTYASTVAPIILTVIAMCYVQHFLEKVSPGVIKPLLVPVGTVVVAGVLGLTILGPLGSFISNGLSKIIIALSNYVPWLVPTFIGAFMPYLVMTGTHLAIMPLGVQTMAAIGKDNVIGPGGLASNLSQGGAALGHALATKDKDRAKIATSVGITALCGTTEPALFGLHLQLKYTMIAMMIGGGLGGLFLGLTRAGRYAMGPSSLLMLTAYIGGDNMSNFIYGCIGSAIAIVVSFVLSYILTKKNEAK